MKIIRAITALAVLISAGLAGQALTIYSDGFALVKDVRDLKLEKGTTTIRFTDVPSEIKPKTVHFRCVDKQGSVSILEQNYEYDLVEVSKLFQKYVDQDVSLTSKTGNRYEGRLLSADMDGIVLRQKDGSIIVVNSDELVLARFPKLPEGLITRPTLVWMLQSSISGKHPCEVSYLSDGVGWEASYIATVNKDDTKLYLDGWVSIDNTSGATYKDAKLKLVAGEVHTVKKQGANAPRYLMSAKANAGAPQFNEESFFEYHLYTLQRPATIKDNQTKELSLFPSAETPVKKVFTYDPDRDNDKVKVSMEFENKKENGLGMPLPKGTVRLYKEDRSGALQFIGEDRIGHTPKDEKVRLETGNAFDIKAERKRTDYSRISDKLSEESYEVSIRNHKDESVSVIVVAHFWGDWYIKKSSIEGCKKDANTMEFTVFVPKDGESKLTYTVRYKR